MKILLIYPPNLHQAVYSKEFRRVKGQETSAYPPLGLMYIQAMVKRETDHEIKLIDLTLPQAKDFSLDHLVREFAPDVVGMTAYTLCFYDALSMARTVKANAPAAKVVMGGPHIDLYPEETLAHPEIDFLVEGDGEIPFLALLRALESASEDFSTVPSLHYRDAAGRPVRTERHRIGKNLDELPYPCRDDIEGGGYFNPFFSDQRFATISTSRGCPFSCTFCDVTDRLYRYRSTDNMLGEIEYLIETRGIRSFFIVDDMFNITTKRVIEFCKAIDQRGLKIRWIFRGRVDQVTDEMVAACAKAGCVHIIFGVEDFTDDGLKAIKKKITTDQVRNVFALVRRYGIKTTANFIIGFPHHRQESDFQILDAFLRELKPDFLQLGILIPFPGSPIFRDGVALGALDPSLWRAYVLDPQPVFEMPLWLEHFDLDTLTRHYERIVKRFYLRPRQILQRLAEIRNARQLAVYWKIGLATLNVGRTRPQGADS